MVNTNLKSGRLTAVECRATLNSITDALHVKGGKWKLRIIVSLKEGNRRFNQMQRHIDGISAKVLSAVLKDLELNGFIRRNVFTGTRGGGIPTHAIFRHTPRCVACLKRMGRHVQRRSAEELEKEKAGGGVK